MKREMLIASIWAILFVVLWCFHDASAQCGTMTFSYQQPAMACTSGSCGQQSILMRRRPVRAYSRAPTVRMRQRVVFRR